MLLKILLSILIVLSFSTASFILGSSYKKAYRYTLNGKTEGSFQSLKECLENEKMAGTLHGVFSDSDYESHPKRYNPYKTTCKWQ